MDSAKGTKKSIAPILIAALLTIPFLFISVDNAWAGTRADVDSNTTVWRDAYDYYVTQDVTIDARVVVEGEVTPLTRP